MATYFNLGQLFGGQLFELFARETNLKKQSSVYRTRSIISQGLYIFTQFFTVVYNQERSMLQRIYAVNEEIHP